MPTYDVLVSDELLPEFTNDNPRMPEGFRIVGPVEGLSGYRSKRFRVEDDNAPEWTEGKLVSPTFTADYDERGEVVRTRVTAYHEENQEALQISRAVQLAEDNPGRTFEAKGGDA
ncbi:MAG TPA: hypothetical protein VFR23_08605 [Jiangellaceae bacterium]|nr:hypothetical protein [Jiangellaceae bacterium]